MHPAVRPSQFLMQLWKHGEGKSESARYSLLMENIQSICPKMSFIWFLPASFCFWAFFFFFLIAEDSSPERLEVLLCCVNLEALTRSRCGSVMPKAQSHFRHKHSAPPCYHSSGRGSQSLGRSHSSLPLRYHPATFLIIYFLHMCVCETDLIPFQMWISLGMEAYVGPSFGSDISTTVTWIRITFCTEIHGFAEKAWLWSATLSLIVSSSATSRH